MIWKKFKKVEFELLAKQIMIKLKEGVYIKCVINLKNFIVFN